MTRRFNFGPDSAGDELLRHATKLKLVIYRGGPDDSPTVDFELSGLICPDDDEETGAMLIGGTVSDPMAVARRLMAEFGERGDVQ